MNNIIRRIWKQNRLVEIEEFRGFPFYSEIQGHTFQITGEDKDGNAIALSGTVNVVFMRSDGTDVTFTGSASGGVVSATLTENCYAVKGRFALTIFLTSDSQKTAIYAACGDVV